MSALVKVHLVDATYELFRHWFAVPSLAAPDGREVGAVRGVLSTLLYLVRQEGATHIGCATDHVIRSFRNDLYAGYKTEAGVPEALLAQFPLVEEGMAALGMVVWPMVEHEADDALATAAARYAAEPTVEQVLIATPDKDLAQCVDGERVVMLDRKQKKILDEKAVRQKWGVAPASIPDWLALVGDTADGYPGLRGWGERSATALLAEYGHLEAIPSEAALWRVKVRGADKLAATLREHRADAELFRTLATVRRDSPVHETLEELRWKGARPSLRDFCERMGFVELPSRVPVWLR